jgi:glycosyltransferase involved in cell wall biosynthesis
MNNSLKLPVVVYVENEADRLRDCLKTVFQNESDDVILVDGDSSDDTVIITKEFSGIKTIESKNSNLTRYRQKGIDAAKNELIAMVDADHRLQKGDLKSLLSDMSEFNLDIVQSGLISYRNHGFCRRGFLGANP